VRKIAAKPLSETKIYPLERGLFIVRYDEAADTASPPAIRVTSETAGEHQVAIITDPDAVYGVLSRPGDCLAVKALQRGAIRVEVEAQTPRGSVKATVKLERLRNGGSAHADGFVEVEQKATPASTTDSDLTLDDFEIIGHVARLGDISVGANEWIAGPTAPSQIEGLSIHWPSKPDGLALRYSAEVGGKGRSTPQTARLGQFSGTKGRSLPLVGLVLELEGEDAPHYELTAEGLFLGSAPVRVRGEKVSLRSSTGREPLVGLKIGIERASAERRGKISAPISAGGVRVFRGRNQSNRNHEVV
jgi:hypothetical protein